MPPPWRGRMLRSALINGTLLVNSEKQAFTFPELVAMSFAEDIKARLVSLQIDDRVQRLAASLTPVIARDARAALQRYYRPWLDLPRFRAASGMMIPPLVLSLA